MSKFLLTSRSKWIDPKEFDSNIYSCNSSKECVLEADLEYPKELCELNNDYSLVLDKKKSEKKCCLAINKRLQIFIIFRLVMLKNWYLKFLVKKNVCFMKTYNFVKG